MKQPQSIPPCLRLKRSFLFMLLGSLILFSCSKDHLERELDRLLHHHGDGKGKLPTTIDFTRTSLYPEGVAFDARNLRFFVSSLRFGTIGQVSPGGVYSPFITDERFVSTIGLESDAARQRLLVAVSDPGAGEKSSPATAGKLAALGIYDLQAGSVIHFVDLAALRPEGRHFANDIALDPQGNAYVTDSFSPVIYKVDPEGNASVFVELPAFATVPGQFGFNGIVYHPHGYLLVGHSQNKQIVRISLSNPEEYQVVQLDTPYQGPDGLLLSQDGIQLVVVDNQGGQVLSFRSSDAWGSGTFVESYATGAVNPTSVTGYKGQVFVLYSYLSRLFAGNASPQSVFTIQRVPFLQNRTF